jgi:lipid A 3-O-deacylase
MAGKIKICPYLLGLLLPCALFSRSYTPAAPDTLSPQVTQIWLENTIAALDSAYYSNGYDPSWLGLKGFYLGTEQDILNLFAPNEDRNYSMGFALGFIGPNTNKDYLLLPVFRRWITGIPLLFTPKKQRDQSLFNERHRAAWFGTFDFKTAGFTPRELLPETPVVGDRPYANPVSLSSTLHRLVQPRDTSGRAWHVRTSMQLGIFGTGIGREFQKTAHRDHWFGSTRDIPQGWGNQIANGGGVSFLYTLGMATPVARLSREQEKHKFRIQTVANAELMAGWYTNIALGAGVKIGWFKTPFWIGNDISSRDISQGASDNNIHFKDRNYGCWMYFRPRIRLVAHNALLTGQAFGFLGKESPYTMSPGEINRAIFEFETGVGVKLKAWTLTVEPCAGRSPEYHTSYKRWHLWGTIHLALVLHKRDTQREALLNYRNQLQSLLQQSGGGEEEE